MSLISGSSVTGAGGVAAYQVSRSLRFNPADSAYLNRTLGSSNRRTFTFSTWVKRSSLGAADNQTLFGCLNTVSGVNQQFAIQLLANETLMVFHFNSVDSTYFYYPTLAVFRDPSAWYHIVVGIDTTQATSTNRCKLYVNGVEQALNSPNNFTQNLDLFVNSGLSTGIGTQVGTGTGNLRYLGGYMAEVYFIDGQQLTPSSFGRTNTATGVWEPLAYTGTYGTNGFYLNFSDNASTTTLGDDLSGNGNDWTTNNFSVTAGAGNDSLVDSPTSYGTDTGAGGEVRGNYATLNPLDKNSGITLSNGNLDASMPTQVQNVYGTVSVTSGKWYWETTINSMSGRLVIGVGNAVDQSWNLDPASSSSLWGYYSVNGNKLNAGSVAYGNSFTTNDVIGVAVDMDSGKIWFSKNNTWQASGDPAAGTNAAFTNLSGSVRPMYDQQLTNAVTFSCNFGQRAFAYTAPSGFKALCTQNLPTPTIGATSTTQANDYFNTILYTGTGSSNARTGVGFQPDWVWIKERNAAADHGLYDAVRGVQNQLESNTTTAETAEATGLTAFGTDGFTVGALAQLNTSGDTYVAWNWKANGAGSSNTDGTIASTVSANTTSGFSIVTYTGTLSAGTNPSPTVGHGLGVAPSLIISKSRNVSAPDGGAWHVNHVYNYNNYLRLNTTAAGASISGNGGGTPANPTSTVFSAYYLSGSGITGNNYVAYCFAPVTGYSAFGSYTGNGSADGPMIFTGFRPSFILTKRTDSANYWMILDDERSTYNPAFNGLYPNLSDAEGNFGNSTGIDFLSNGFKLRDSVASVNASGGTYIYMAVAESPFKYSLAR